MMIAVCGCALRCPSCEEGKRLYLLAREVLDRFPDPFPEYPTAEEWALFERFQALASAYEAHVKGQL